MLTPRSRRCSCDVPAHSYTFSWEGNPRWSKAYVGAEELFDYFKSRAVNYGVYDYLHLHHRVTSAEWNDEKGKWKVKIEDLESKTTIKDEAEVLINAAGFLNSWKWPEIPGLQSFSGHLAHSARWDDTYEFKDKAVAVIGAGSSGIQIVPQLQPGESATPL
jgi:cation diffusion facilitator CzcD-associated flavoprotein CzcO